MPETRHVQPVDTPEPNEHDPLWYAGRMTRDQALDTLQALFPQWEIWCVPLAVGGYRWCSRRRDNHRILKDSSTPRWLAFELAAWEREHRSDLG